MKKWFKLIALFICLSAVLVLPAFADDADAASVSDGLVQTDDGLYYYQDGVPFCGGLKQVTDADGNAAYYYFQADGTAYHEGTLKVTTEDDTEAYYYFQANGQAYTSGYKATSTYAEADSSCTVTKSSDTSVRRYFFQSNGQAYHEGTLKFTNANGTDFYFYFQKNGEAYTSGYKATNTYAEADSSCTVTKSSDTSTRRYYFQSNGQAYHAGTLKFTNANGTDFYFYFQKNGEAYTSGYKATSTYAEADSSCTVTKSSDTSTRRYYFQSNGQAYHAGTLKFTNANGTAFYYYFQKSGEAYTSGYKATTTYATASSDCVVTKSSDTSTRRYYFQSNGQAYTKGYLQFTNDNGTGFNYYFQSNGLALLDSWKTISGGRYYFGSNGQGYKGWHTIDDSKYYFNSDSMALTGKQTVGNYLCYFDDNGVLTRSINKNGKMVAVTYDDGPSQYTSTILDVLEENDAVATFFVVGNRVSSYASTAKRAVTLGCEIGNHTYDHVNLTKKSTSEIKSQVSKTNDAVKKATGVTPVILRPPGGNFNSTVKSTVGMPLIYWSIDTRDWEHRNTQTTINNVLNNVRDGDIILMHDLYSSTANAAKTIIPTLIDRGYQLVTVSELAECRGGMQNGTVYYSFHTS